jgi:hypothetical protein
MLYPAYSKCETCDGKHLYMAFTPSQLALLKELVGRHKEKMARKTLKCIESVIREKRYTRPCINVRTPTSANFVYDRQTDEINSNDKIKLLIVDSIINNYRVEYAGRSFVRSAHTELFYLGITKC